MPETEWVEFSDDELERVCQFTGFRGDPRVPQMITVRESEELSMFADMSIQDMREVVDRLISKILPKNQNKARFRADTVSDGDGVRSIYLEISYPRHETVQEVRDRINKARASMAHQCVKAAPMFVPAKNRVIR